MLQPTIYDAIDQSPSTHHRPKEHKGKRQAQPPLLQPVSYNQQRSVSKARLDTHRPVSIEEECEDEAHPDSAVSGMPPLSGPTFPDDEKSSSTPQSAGVAEYDLLPFEIVSPGRRLLQAPRAESSRSRGAVVDMTKIRVKVHGERDTRYVMISPTTTFDELVELVRKKFGLLCGDGGEMGRSTGEFKVKIRDEEGDMVTLGDQEDLDMAVQACREGIAAIGNEEVHMGKMEVWVMLSSSDRALC